MNKSSIFLIVNLVVQFYLCYMIGWITAKQRTGRKILSILHEIKEGDNANEVINKLIDAHTSREGAPYGIQLTDKFYDYVKSPKHDKQSK